MIDDQDDDVYEPTDEEVEESVEEQFRLAKMETMRMMQHWSNRDANPLIVTPVIVTAILTSVRLGFDRDTYDQTVRSILSAVEQEVQDIKGDKNGSRRGLH